ncbi:Uncharacterised protein [Mycobacterium tuberculosis]|nr:Uncharacterised protein [Mycobacterium tuberculosis]
MFIMIKNLLPIRMESITLQAMFILIQNRLSVLFVSATP